MQRNKWFFILLLFKSITGNSQINTIESFNKQKQEINRNGMLILGSWGLANIAYGAIAVTNATGSDRYFHQMNLIWGGINLGLSAIGYLGSRKRQILSASETFRQQSIVEKTFIFNAGLDVAYIVGGVYLKEKATNKPTEYERLKGFGNSIILQGASLLLFDGIMFAIHSRHGTKIYKKATLQMAVTDNGIGFVVKI